MSTKEQKSLSKLYDSFSVYKTDIEGRCEATVKLYLRNIKEFCDECGVVTVNDLTNITAQDIKDWLIKLAENNIGSTTRNNKLSSIKQFFEFLDEELDMKIDKKIRRIKFAKTPIKESKYVDADTLKKVLKVVNTQYLRLAILILYYTGLRFSELQQITCDDIINGEVVIVGKGNKERHVYFTPEIVIEGKKYIATERAKVLRDTEKETNLLLVNLYGNPLVQQTFEKALKVCGKKANIDWYNELSPHKFRHGCITHYLNTNTPIQIVRDIAGHSSISTTNRYAHADQNAIKEYMRNIRK